MNISSTKQLRLSSRPDLREFQHPRARAQEKVNEFIDDAAVYVGTAFWGATGTGLGALAGATASTVVPEYGLVLTGVGAVGGGLAAATAYSHGHGDTMGRSLMAVAAVGFSTGVGYFLGGGTGAIVGGALGAAYAGTGIYFALDS